MDQTTIDRAAESFDMIGLNPIDLRELGNACFKNKLYWKAISYYTKSLTRSPAGSRLRGLAYANRSAVLLSIGLYEESISDALIALQNDYPTLLSHKLYLRMGTCKKAMGKQTEAEVDFHMALKLVDDIGLKPEKEKEAKEGILKQSSEEHNKAVLPKVQVEYQEPPELSYGKNPADPMISSALLILKRGKGLVAQQKIEAGDVLVVESSLLCETLCASASGETRWIYCSECFKMCLNLMPCSTCSWACYCSEECSKTAWEKYHKFECTAKEKLMKKIMENNSGKLPYSHYNTVSQTFKLISFFGLEKCCLNPVEKLEVPGESSYVFNKFFCQEVNHQSFWGLSTKALELMADVFHLSAERKENFVTNMSRALHQLRYFTFPICHAVISHPKSRSTDELSFSQEVIGQGTYFRASIIGLSCKPNVHSAFYQKTMVLRALRCIEEGEEICQSNGLDVYVQPITPSQQKWKKFSSNCNCDSCVGNKLLFQEEKNYVLRTNPAAALNLQELFDKKIDSSVMMDDGYPISSLTLENYETCVKILNLYGKKRKDDDLTKKSSKFVEKYFTSLTIQLVGAQNNSKKSSHLIPLAMNW